MMPETCDIGFKEWAGICDALGSGKQTIILRKGGIDETAGPGLFVPEHSAFWLYPTHLHQSQQQPGEEMPAESCPPGMVPISVFAVAQSVGRVDDEEMLDELREYHAYADETVRNRFHYRTPGLWVLALRTYTRDTPYLLQVTPEQEGCKSWVPLGQPLATAGTRPVLGEEAWLILKMGLQSLLKRS